MRTMATEEAPTQNPPDGLSEKVSQSYQDPVESSSSDKSSHIKQARWRTLYNRLGYVPTRVRYDPDKPFEFSMSLNILFGLYLIPATVNAANSSSSFRRMLHRRKSLLQPPHPQQAGCRLQCHR